MNGEQRARVRAIVHGHVQGVGYRMFAVTHAQARGLVGYARNVPDGRTVEVVAEGARRDLLVFVDELREGPLAARVEEIDVAWDAPRDDMTGFGVR